MAGSSGIIAHRAKRNGFANERLNCGAGFHAPPPRCRAMPSPVAPRRILTPISRGRWSGADGMNALEQTNIHNITNSLVQRFEKFCLYRQLMSPTANGHKRAHDGRTVDHGLYLHHAFGAKEAGRFRPDNVGPATLVGLFSMVAWKLASGDVVMIGNSRVEMS